MAALPVRRNWRPATRGCAIPGIRGADRGLAATRVAGAAQARGEYLLFLDHDNRLRGDALERLAAVLDTQLAAAAVFAAARWWYGREDHPKNADQSYLPWRSGMMHGRRVLRRMILRDRPHPCVHATMFRRAEYITASDSDPLREMVFEDASLLYKLLTRRDIYLLDEEVADYRIRANSMSYTQDSRMAPFLRLGMARIAARSAEPRLHSGAAGGAAAGVPVAQAAGMA